MALATDSRNSRRSAGPTAPGRPGAGAAGMAAGIGASLVGDRRSLSPSCSAAGTR